MRCKIYDLKENIPKIKQNSFCYFEIKKSEKWSNSLEISLNPYEKINMENLYHIIMSYIKNEEIVCISIAFAWNTNKNLIVVENIRARKIKNLDISEFSNWILFRIFNDKKYDPEKIGFISILLTFNKKIIEKLNLNENKEILDYYRPMKPLSIKLRSDQKLKILYKKFPYLRKIKF